MADVHSLRKQIDAIDRQVVELLNARATIAMEIGRSKIGQGMPIYDPDREEEIMRHVTSEHGGPLTARAIRRVFERIIDEIRTVERSVAEANATKKG
jgi:chorismate mutase